MIQHCAPSECKETRQPALTSDKTLFSRRSVLKLSAQSAVCLGMGLIPALHARVSQADERASVAGTDNLNVEGEYSFLPEESLTQADVPSTRSRRAASPSVSVVGLGGADRYETVAKEARYAYPRCKTAVIASGAGFADSICAAGLAGALTCPILLVAPTYVPEVTKDALRSMGVTSMILLGSSVVANSEVEATLRSFGQVTRLAGSDRYTTQMAVYRYGQERGLWSNDWVIVASALGFADALSASPVSYALRAPIFFCDETRGLPAAQWQALREELTVPNFMLLGSTDVTSSEVEENLRQLAAARRGTAVRLGGATRYQTSMAIAEYAVNKLQFTWDNLAFCSGRGPYDALGGGPVQGEDRSVLLLADEVDSSSVDVVVKNGGHPTSTIKFFGSEVVVSQDVRRDICKKLGVPYYERTSFVNYGITREHMAELQVKRSENNSCTYSDYFQALDPSRHTYGTSAFYQFALLDGGYSGVTAQQIDAYVAANCVYQEKTTQRTSQLRGLGSAFVEAATRHGINEVYLLAHAIWESGWGCSQLACGWTPTTDGEVIVGGRSYPYTHGTTYYNFYGIGAVDSNALAGGKALAVKEGWTSPQKAVIGAAQWLSNNYVRRTPTAQPTLYLMKWDVPGAERTGSAWHEYCTGLDTWTLGIAGVMYRCYRHAGWEFGQGMAFSVPVFARD